MAWTALAVVLVACAANKPSNQKMDWVYAAIRPPAEYETWFEETEQCLGLNGNYDKVTWLVVRTPKKGTFRVGAIDDLVGYTAGKPNGGAVIMLSQRFWLAAEVVRHESIYAITGRAHGQLPESIFARCSEGVDK